MSLDDAISNARQQLNIDTQLAYLGDGSGDPRDRVTIGNYFVRLVQADGRLSKAFSIPAHPNAKFPVVDGFAVRLGYDEDGDQVILGAYRPGVQSAGVNPLTLNPLDTVVNKIVTQANFSTFYFERHGDMTNKPLTVSVFPAFIVIGTSTTYFPGDEIDIASFVPSTGLHCFVVVLWKTDNTLEAFSSTPINTADPLSDTDIQEAINQRSTGSLPICGWRLVGDQTTLTSDETQRVDLRQMINVVEESSGGSGITQLTGDVTAGPGSGSQAATLVSGTGATFSGSKITDYEDYTEASTPTTPASNHLRIWAADDNGVTVWYTIDSTGQVIELARDEFLIVKNTTGATLTRETWVYVSGVDSGIPTVSKAMSNNQFLQLSDGMVMADIANNAIGRIMLKGIFTPYDTSGYTAGDRLFINVTASAGTVTNTEPAAGAAWSQEAARALDSTASGHILILHKPPRYDYLFAAPLNIGSKGGTVPIQFSTSAGIAILQADSGQAGKTISMPTPSGATDTLVARTTTDTLTNKSFDGDVTFDDGVTVNNSAGSAGDFRVKGDTDNDALVVDVSTDATGMGTATPNASAKLHVVSTTKGSIARPVMTAAQVAAIGSPAEGLRTYESDTEHENVWDGQRNRIISPIGYSPFAYPLFFSPSAGLATTLTLPTNGGSIAIPMWVQTHMLVDSVTIRNLDVSTARTWAWDLYEEFLNNGNSGENTLTRVAASNGSDTFTAAAASNRTLAAASAPVYIAAGVYWLVIQNRHATSSFAFASTASGHAAFGNTAQTKTTTNPNGATLDFVAATWTKVTAIYGARIDGRVFGETTIF